MNFIFYKTLFYIGNRKLYKIFRRSRELHGLQPKLLAEQLQLSLDDLAKMEKNLMLVPTSVLYDLKDYYKIDETEYVSAITGILSHSLVRWYWRLQQVNLLAKKQKL